MLQHIPNILTLLRILFIPLIGILAYYPSLSIFNALLYTVIGYTDMLDGWIARKYNLQSRFGQMLDPIADKLLFIILSIVLIHLERITGIVMVAIMICITREIFISGVREYMNSQALELPSPYLAKVKTYMLLFAIGILLSDNWGQKLSPYLSYIAFTLIIISTVITLTTSYQYCKTALQYSKRYKKD